MLYGLDVGAHTAVTPHYTSSHTNTDAGYRLLLGWAGGNLVSGGQVIWAQHSGH